MPEPVVDGFEAIEVEVGHAQQGGAAARLFHGLLQAVCQLHAVGQAGEGVEMGQAVQLLLLGALLRYVHAHTHHAQGLAIGTGADDFAQAAYPAWWCVGWLRNAQRNRAAVDLDLVAKLDALADVGGLVVDRDAATQNHALHLQPRAQARLRQHLVQLGLLQLRLQHALGRQVGFLVRLVVKTA